MEMSLVVDGYHISVSAHNGSCVLYVKDRGDEEHSVEVAVTSTMARMIGFSFTSAADEIEGKE